MSARAPSGDSCPSASREEALLLARAGVPDLEPSFVLYPAGKRRPRQRRGAHRRLRPPARGIAQLASACPLRLLSRTDCKPLHEPGGCRGHRRASPVHRRRLGGVDASPLPGDRARVLPFALRGLRPSRRGSDGVRRRRDRVGRGPLEGPGRARSPFRSVQPGGHQRLDRAGPVRRGLPRSVASARLGVPNDLGRRCEPDRRRLRSAAWPGPAGHGAGVVGVAIVSPFPPVASGIANYSFRLVEELAALGDLDIDCFADGLDFSPGPPSAPSGSTIYDARRLLERGSRHRGLRRRRLRPRQQRVPYRGVGVAPPPKRDGSGPRREVERPVPFRGGLESGRARRGSRHAPEDLRAAPARGTGLRRARSPRPRRSATACSWRARSSVSRTASS